MKSQVIYFSPIRSIQFGRSVVSDFLRPHELQHARLPCPSPFPGVCSNSCPLNRWCHPTISPSVTPFSSCPQSFPSIRVFSNEWTLHIRWPKSWSFSFSISLPAGVGVLKPWFYKGSWLSCKLSSLAWVHILPCHLLIVNLRNSLIQLPSNLYFFHL